jgi:hypothetical protein
MLSRQKTDQPFRVDFAVILRYIALLAKKVAKMMIRVLKITS